MRVVPEELMALSHHELGILGTHSASMTVYAFIHRCVQVQAYVLNHPAFEYL